MGRKIISILSSLSLYIGAFLYPLTQIHAANAEGTKENAQVEQVKEVSEYAQSLIDKIEGRSGETQHALDYYHLLDQQVFNLNQIATNNQKASAKRINDYMIVLDEFITRLEETDLSIEEKISLGISLIKDRKYSQFDDETSLKYAQELLSVRFKKDKKKIKAMSAESLDETALAAKIQLGEEKLVGLFANFKPEDYIEDFADFVEQAKVNRNYRTNLKIGLGEDEIFQGQDQFLKESQLQLKQAIKLDNNKILKIYNKKGELINQIDLKVSFAQFFGNYLVFMKQSEASKEGLKEVHYIDLKTFRASIGNNSLPIFKFPLDVKGKITSVEVSKGALVINGVKIKLQAMKNLSSIHQISFNIMAGLLDPNTFNRSKEILKEAHSYFKGSLKSVGKKLNKEFESSLSKTKEIEPAAALITSEIEELNNTSDVVSLIKDIETEGVEHPYVKILSESGTAMNMSKESHAQSRKFLTRVRLLMAEIAAPRKENAKIILNALVSIASVKNLEKVKEGASVLNASFIGKTFKYGVSTTGAAAFASLLPIDYHIYMMEGIEIGQKIASNVHGYFASTSYGLAYFDLLGEAATIAIKGPLNVGNAYFAGDKIGKFLIGVSSVVTLPFMVFAVPHVLVNSYITFKRVFYDNWKLIVSDLNEIRWGVLQEKFIAHINFLKNQFDDANSKAESEISGGQQTFSDEELEELDKIIERDRKRSKQTQKAAREKAEDAKKVAEDLAKDFKKATNDSIEVKTYAKALVKFLFSYPALTQTYVFLAGTWNYIFISRSLVWRPKTWILPFIYPSYFSVATRELGLKDKSKERVHVPSEYNGGLESVVDKVNKFKLTKERKQIIKKFEDSVLDIERVVQDFATQKALLALFKRTKNPERLNFFFNGLEGSIGVTGLDDPNLQKLKGEDRAFFRSYFTKSFEETMTKYLSAIQLNEEGRSVPEFKRSLGEDDLKKMVLEIDKGKDKILKEIEAIYNSLDTGAIFTWANRAASGFGSFFLRKKVNYQHNLFKTLSSKNGTLSRYAVARRKLKDPKSVARAVRAEVASLLVSKPLQLVGILAMYAGVTEGVLMPLHDEMFGPNSIFYMSRQVFFSGFAAGTIVSIMADTWYKIQVDDRIDSNGGFQDSPSKIDQYKGFWRYYFKNFKNPENGFWDNQLYIMKLVWINIPATIVLYSAIQFSTLGRFDLGIFLAGYFYFMVPPFQGLNTKIEQSFELASSWITSKIPKKYRSNPKALDYINMQIQKQKLKFNLFHQSYEIVITQFLEIFTLINTDEYGKRSFLRLLFNGYTPTELAALGLRKTGEFFGFIPGIEIVTTKCEELLTNNYTDWQKVAPLKGN